MLTRFVNHGSLSKLLKINLMLADSAKIPDIFGFSFYSHNSH